MQSIIPKGPCAGDWKVFKESVSVLVTSEARSISLFIATRTPLPTAESDIAVQTAADKLLEPSYPSSELLLIAPVTTIGLSLFITKSKK